MRRRIAATAPDEASTFLTGASGGVAGPGLRPWPCTPVLPDFASLLAAAAAIESHGRGTGLGHVAADAHVGSGVEAFEWPAAPPAGMTLSALPTGSIRTPAAMAFAGGAWRDMRDFALTPVLVRHPRGDVLIDAGLSADWPRHHRAMPWLQRTLTRVRRGVPAARQLRAAAAAAHGVVVPDAIVLTHAHWDHVGGIADFAGVPVWMAPAEAEFVRSGHPHTQLARSVDPKPLRTFEFRDGPRLGFDASCDFFGDGSLVVVPAPGHTPGSVVVLVALPSGRRLAFVGDIVWQMEGVERGVERPWLARLIADHAPEQVRRAIVHLARLHRRMPGLAIVPAHDARAIGALPVWPATLG